MKNKVTAGIAGTVMGMASKQGTNSLGGEQIHGLEKSCTQGPAGIALILTRTRSVFHTYQ